MPETTILAVFPHEPLSGVRMRQHRSVGPDGWVTLDGWARCRWCTFHMSFADGRDLSTCTARPAWAARVDRAQADAEQAARDEAIAREDAALAAAEDADAARRAAWSA